uniref:Dolichyl-diphosphooligosaccharide--protein glycosyltransferase subunit 1 n=1 Tax=Molossus molossus TaxID=27622 RepID=A0A7J8DT51_MOLMO|nr:hypothetical protein HJG59_009115 [Molossus molossus]
MVHYTSARCSCTWSPCWWWPFSTSCSSQSSFTSGLDNCITKDLALEARMKVTCITEQVSTLLNKRIDLYHHFDETVSRCKQSWDVATLNSGRKSLEKEHKALTSEIMLLQSRLKTKGSDLCGRVSGMQKLEAQVKELVLKSAVQAKWWWQTQERHMR